MQDALYHQRFTQSLEHFSARLDDMLLDVRRFDPSLIPAELLDEIASTLGKLMLVLIEHKSSDGVNGFTRRAASDTRRLREVLRFGYLLQSNQLTEAMHALREELGVVIYEDKQAA